MDDFDHLLVLFFKRRVLRLLSCTLSLKILNNAMKVQIWANDDGIITIAHPEIENEEIDALVLNLRLIQQDNDLSIKNITPVVKRILTENQWDKWRSARDRLNKFLDEEVWPNKLPEVSRRRFLDTFLYGVYAHSNLDLYNRAYKWSKDIGKDELNTAMLAILHSYLEYVQDFHSILESV